MAHERSSFWPIVTLVLAIICLIIALPSSWKPYVPVALRPELHLGLDLAGGTQLDFRISEDEITERERVLQEQIRTMQQTGDTKNLQAKQAELMLVQEQHKGLVEAIRTVLERRINSLGVSEATITPSFFGEEKHLLVECPGIINIERCISTVGKTIRLEFKEEFSGDATKYAQEMTVKAQAVARAVTTGTGSLQVYGQDLSDHLGVTYYDYQPMYLSALPKGLEALATRKTTDPVLLSRISQQAVVDTGTSQELKEVKSIVLAKVLENSKPAARTITDTSEALRELAKQTKDASFESKVSLPLSAAPAELQPTLKDMSIGSEKVVVESVGSSAIVLLHGRTEPSKEISVSHILIQYKGADRADGTVTRSKERARAMIEDIQRRLKSGANFASIAASESDGPSKQKAGSLGTIRQGAMVPAFEAAAFTLKKGQQSDIVETAFGFHIIQADSDLRTVPPAVSYDILRIKGDQKLAEKLLKNVRDKKVTVPDQQVVIRAINFSLEPTGWQDTALNGTRFRSAAINIDPATGAPLVQIQFDEQGGKMFQELTKRNIGKKIAIFVGGELVSAPTVQNEIVGGNAVITGSQTIVEAKKLAQDLNTGAIPAPIYLVGQNTVEATLGASALEQSVLAAAAGLLVLCVFMILIYRVFGVIASIALIFYVILLVASTKLPLLLITREYVVLTLAGIAGIILSMGMAVDANVLAFERVKEELRRGKSLKTAVEIGFSKAWPSVRDGNFSTLITCAILFMIGTSIIRGFAITLAIGIFISLFTGMIVSRFLCRLIANSPLADRLELFGVSKKQMPSR